MPWYEGPTLLHHLEHVYIGSDRNLIDVRFPVQYVIRPMSHDHHDYRGYAGQVASGMLRPGDEVVVLPSGFTTTIAGIDVYGGPIEEAIPPMSVSVRLADDLDVSRGDMICRPNNLPDGHPGRRRDGLLVQRAAAAAGRDRTRSSTRPAPPRRAVQRPALPARRQHAAPRRGRTARSRSTTSAGSRCAPRCRCSSTSTAATASPAASSSSTRARSRPSARA